MIKIEKVDVYGFEPALRGMRNAKKSWRKSDSYRCTRGARCEGCPNDYMCNVFMENTRQPLIIGKKDHELATKLVRAGSEHAKFKRDIDVWLDITAPLAWWREWDTYHVGMDKNSCSTMHSLTDEEFKISDWAIEELLEVEDEDDKECVELINRWVDLMNRRRSKWFTKGKHIGDKLWWKIKKMNFDYYNLKATLKVNYQTLSRMYHQRKNHLAPEWKEFCKWIKTLPYSEFITGEVG